MDEQIKKLVENDLCIRRVPRKDLAWFKEYAKEEYEGDYGMLLKQLIAFYKGQYAETMLSGLDLVHQKLDKIEGLITPVPEQSGSDGPKTVLQRIEERRNKK